MIDRREILETATRLSLRPDVVEKDYVLGWMLAGIFQHEELAANWIFKGGTCLKKCFFETYRFSEDLDFTLRDESHIDQAFLARVFRDIGEWIEEQTGIEVPSELQEFEILRNPRGNLSCQGKITYRGPISPARGSPRIKLDLTADERLVLPPVQTGIFHPYSDAPEEGIAVLAYDYVEAFAEKFRALAERTRPRDLYDVVALYRNTDDRPEPARLVEVLQAKCEFKGIALPRLADLETHRSDVEAGWEHMLNHQLPDLLPVSSFWEALPEIFAWMDGAVVPLLPQMAIAAGADLVRDRVIVLPSGTAGQSLIDRIRFAAYNRLIVEIDYRDQKGIRSTREIEAYSLRRSKAGDILLMAVRADNGESRSYRIDNLLGVKTTQKSFVPKYPIELSPSSFQATPVLTRSISTSSGGFGLYQPSRPRGIVGSRPRKLKSMGPTYNFRCPVCGKKFKRASYDATARPHKNKDGRDCYGTYLTYEGTSL